MSKKKNIEDSLLTSFGCFKCGGEAMLVTPIMPEATEDNEPGLLIECIKDGKTTGVLTITMDMYEMLLDREKHMIKEHIDLLKKRNNN